MRCIEEGDIDAFDRLIAVERKGVCFLFAVDHDLIARRAICVDQLCLGTGQITIGLVRIIDRHIIDICRLVERHMQRQRQFYIVRQLAVFIMVAADIPQQFEVTAIYAVKQLAIGVGRAALDQFVHVRAVIARQELIGHREGEIAIFEGKRAVLALQCLLGCQQLLDCGIYDILLHIDIGQYCLGLIQRFFKGCDCLIRIDGRIDLLSRCDCCLQRCLVRIRRYMSDDLQLGQRQHVASGRVRMGRVYKGDVDAIHQLGRFKVEFIDRLFFIDRDLIARRAVSVDQLCFRTEQVTVRAVCIVDLDLIDQRCFLQIKMHRDRQLDILRQLFVLIPVGLDIIQQLEITADVAIEQSLVCSL